MSEAVKLSSFDKAYKTYDDHTPVQVSTGLKLIDEFINQNIEFERVLDLGCGTGRTTQALFGAVIPKELDAVDISVLMLQQARTNFNREAVRYICANFDNWLPDSQCKYDLIFANMSLQWSANLPLFLQTCFEHLNPNGQIIFTLPIAGTFIELQDNWQMNDFFTVNEMYKILQNDGFKNVMVDSERYVLDYQSESERLRSIKLTGANKVIQRSVPSQFAKLRRLIQEEKDKTYTLTYEIGFFSAQKVGD